MTITSGNSLQWEPGIGDPTFMGWFTVVAYLFAVFFSFKRMKDEYSLSLCCWQVWFFISILLLFLALNKQLDLQSWMTITLKNHALENGWYADRHKYQAFFIFCLVILSFTSLAILLRVIWQRWKDFIITFTGLFFLVIFILVRASSFHHMDILINTEFSGIRLNWALELSGIFMVGWGARKRSL